jgi:hypothetical protein
MKAAVYNGILGGNVTTLPALCETGNCTWPITPTLAVCGECSKASYQTSCDSTVCNYTMPAGTVTSVPPPSEYLFGVAFQVNSTRGAIYDSRRSDRLYIANFDVFGVSRQTLVWNWSEVVASECALWMCIQGYQVTTVSSRQIQSTIWTLSETENSTFTGDINANITFSALPADKSLGVHANYTFLYRAYIGLTTFLSPLLTGNITFDTHDETSSSDWTQAIWEASPDLDQWINNLAVSMTNVVRAGTPALEPTYNGTAYQLGVSVRWWWLALPVAMVVLSLIFLIITIAKTTQSRVGAWKGSPLTLLFSDVQYEVKDKVSGQMNRCDGLQQTVGRTKVVLECQPTGNWMFKVA